jgi:mannosyltransferase
MVLQDTPDVGTTERKIPSDRRAALAVRIPGLTAAATVVALAAPRLGRRAVWLDEALTVGATRDLVATWRGSGGTMALYYLLMWPVTQLSTERAWIRVPSMLAAAATVVVVHEVGRLTGGRRLAAVAAGTLALSWAVSRFAVEARAYTLAMLLVSVSWLGVVGAVRDRADPVRRRRWWHLFVAAALLAPLAHGMAALHVAGQVAALSLAPDRRRWLRACIPLGAALAAEGLVLFAVGAGEVASWIGPLSGDQVRMLAIMLVGRGPASVLIGGAVVAACVLAVAGYRRDPGEESWLRLVPAFWALGTPLLILALSVVRPYAESRYVISAVPGVALLVGAMLARIRRPALVVAAWLVVAASLWPLQSRVTRTAIEDWPALADAVAAQAADGDRLLMRPILRAPFDYAWAEASDRPVLTPLSPVDPVGEVQRFYDAAGGTLRAQLLADPTVTVWYVERDDARRDDIDALVTDRDVLEHYSVDRRWEFDREMYLVRFEPRPRLT